MFKKKSRRPLIRRTEHIREMIKQNLKAHRNKKTYNNLTIGGNSMGKLHGTCKVHERDYLLRLIV